MVITHTLGMNGVADRTDLVEDFYTCFFKQFNGFHAGGLINGCPGKLDAGHLFLGADPDVNLVVFRRDAQRRQQRNIDHEGLFREFPGFLNGGAKRRFRFVVSSSEITHAPGVGDGCAEAGFTEPHHGAADNGILDPEHFGNGCPEHEWSPSCVFYDESSLSDGLPKSEPPVSVNPFCHPGCDPRGPETP
jgi:hypothetical protein